MNKNTLDELAGKLADAVPGELHDLGNDLGNDLRNDLQNNFRGLLAAGLEKMDLVTREEFDVQRKVLERTRDKLDRLEAQLAELQARANASAADD